MTLNELLNTPFQKEITAGKHTAFLLKMPTFVDNQTNPENSYLICEFDFDNGDCTYKRNMFLRDVSIMLSHLRRQLGRQNETIIPMQFFKELVDNKTPFNVWVEYVVVPTRRGTMERRQNIRFIEKLEATAPEADDDSDELLG